MSLQLEDLPVRTEVGKGGFARVSDLPGFRLSGEDGPFVLKRYHPSVVRKYPGIGAALGFLIGHRQRLPDEDRRRLDRRTRWPLAIVRHEDAVVGLIMSRIADRFWFEMVTARGPLEPRLRKVDMYFRSPERAAEIGLGDFPLLGRMMAVARFGAQLEFLHGIGITVGDIQGGNLAVDPNPGDRSGPRICMFDCDSYRVKGSVPAIPQAHAMSWQPPELRQYRLQAAALPEASPDRGRLEAMAAVQTRTTDVYKFGLVLVRTVAMRDGISTSIDPEVAAPTLRRADVLGPRRTDGLLTTLAPDPRDRPTMTEVMRTLAGS